MTIQIIRDEKNRPAYAVVPWKDYVELVGDEDASDALGLAKAEAARGEERFPADVVERLIARENPIKVYREWRRMTQAELAKASGLAPLYISQLETGHRKLGAKAAKKLAPVLDIGLDVLLDDAK